MGPHRDLVGRPGAAVRKQGMRVAISNHGMENFTFIAPNHELRVRLEAAHADLFDPAWAAFYNVADRSDAALTRFLANWVDRNDELIDRYRPDMLWFDNGVNLRVLDPLKLRVAAYYYNRAREWGREVTLATKFNAYAPSNDDTKQIGSIVDFEKVSARSPAGIRPGPWMVDDALGTNSWGYIEGLRVSPPAAILGKLIDTVSKGGFYMLNISPMADGVIPEDQQDVLRKIGAWLDVNGEAIYGTRPWKQFMEAGKPAWHFTKKGDAVYAIASAWPEGTDAVVSSLRTEQGKVAGSEPFGRRRARVRAGFAGFEDSIAGEPFGEHGMGISDYHGALKGFLLLAGAMTAWGQTPDIDARVESLLRQMTQDEKAGQLNQLTTGYATGPGGISANHDELLAEGKIGSLFNANTALQTNHYQRIAVEKSRLHIPVLFGLDVIHGFRTIYPVPLGMSATWDIPLIERTARMAAEEASAQGIRWTFSPMLDVARDARWGRMVEGAGEDPWLGSVVAKAWVRGYQGDSLSASTSILACAKHFVGYGAAESGREYNSTQIPERLLRDVYLPPFHAAVDQGAATLMSAFSTLNDVPATADAFTLTEILRKEWGFRGFVVSDYNSIRELIAHGIANDEATAARKAFVAGVDMDMEGHVYLPLLASLVDSGAVRQERFDDAVRRVLRLKFALGLFDRPYMEEVSANPTAEHLAGEAAARTDLNLPAAEQQLLESMVATGKPVVLVLFSGRPLTIGWAAAHVPAIIEAWFPGLQAGPALVHTIFGDVNPAGRLTVSFPRSVGQEPLYYNALNTGRPPVTPDEPLAADFGNRYSSRYIDEKNSPLYPFGFGLSYTEFRYGKVQVDARRVSASALNTGTAFVTARADVTNIGSRAGVETAQLYIRLRGTSVARPVRELKGFERVALAPGETKRVEFRLGREELKQGRSRSASTSCSAGAPLPQWAQTLLQGFTQTVSPVFPK